MKKLIDIKRFKFYLWVGLAFSLLGLFSDYAQHSNAFLERVLNHIWAVSYVTIVNYFFFEYMLPLLSRKRIFKSLLRILAYMFLYSWVSYLWKCIGISLHIYTSLVTFSSTSEAVSNRMEYSVESLFFSELSGIFTII